MMFRRKDEDENEYLIQPVNKSFNPTNNSGFTTSPRTEPQASSQLFGQNVPLNNQYNDEPHQPQTSVPYVKTNSAAANQSNYEAPKYEPKYEAPPAPKAEMQTQTPQVAKEPKEPKAQNKPAASVNNFVPSAIRASSSNTNSNSLNSSTNNQNNQTVQNSTTSQLPNFSASTASKSNLKIDNLAGLETERRLTVGYGISLEGKVSDCDKLVIYGSVHAELNNVKALQISDSGKFRGAAEIDYAEISGVFEGELKVRKSIVISPTGRVSGKITYGSIEIKPGGKFTGEIVEDLTLSNTASSENNDQNALNQDYNLFIDQKSENKAA